MSLFKSRQFWTTSSEDDEYFDQSSLIVSKLNSDYDYVITGSQSGVLRIFRPNCRANDDGKFAGFHPNDVIVEKIFDVPILEIGSGRLVSGSHTTHLAILQPKLLSVYSLTCVPGKADLVTVFLKSVVKMHELFTDRQTGFLGDQSYLELLYEHKLRKTAYNFAIGPFGGHQNRDFICVQSLDGMLTFFEQDTQITHVGLPDFLLPGPLAYIVKNDSFITVSCDWGIVCYRYKVLSESADESTDPIYAKPKIVSEWQFDLNEAVIDIQVINDVVNNESRLVVLGEKNLFCLTDSGRLRFMNKLGYSPICMNCYVIEDNLLTLLISETSVLLVYENTMLKWSAHLDFLPTAISRAFLKEIKGALVLLGEEGRLECCYLGTEPSFFVAPPLNLQEIDFAQAEKELTNLEKILSSYNNNDASMQNQIEKDLITTVTVNTKIEICTFEHNIKNAASNYMCEIKIHLLPHVVFQEVQISLALCRPLKVVPNIHFFSNLTDSLNVSSYVFLDEALDVPSLQVDVKVSVINNFGVPRTITKMVMLPVILILELCDAEKDNKHKVTLSSSQGPIGLQKLFSAEYSNDESFSSFNSVGFKSPSGSVGTILLAKSSDKYRIQSDCFTMLSVLVEQLTTRLKSGSPDCKIFINSSLPTLEILKYANEHFSAKQRVKLLQNDLSQLSSQFRLIQKRLITKYRAKNPISLKSLELLLNDTYADVLEVTDKLENELDNLTKAQTDLSCALSLVKQLVDFFDIDTEQLISIKSAFSLEVHDMDTQTWEDVMDASLCFLLRTVMAKTEKDRLRAPHTSFDEVKDLAKFEKHLTQVLDRLPKLSRLKISSEAVSEDKEHSDKQSQEESKLEKPIGSQYGEFSSRLISARKSLMKRHKVNEEDVIESSSK